MQEPLPYTDEPLETDLVDPDAFEDPAFPMDISQSAVADEPPLPFPGGDDDSATHASSQREILLAQYRQRANGETEDSDAPRSVEFDEADVAFPGAAETAAQPQGVSQREIIMQQQREILLRQAGIDPSTRGKNNQAKQSNPAPSERAQRSWFSRRTAYASIIISLAIVLLAGGTVATSDSGPLRDIAGAITPDVIENWIGQRVSGIADANATPEVATTVDTPSVTEPVGNRGTSDVNVPPAPALTLRAQIVNTEGDGVSVRSICIPEARSTDTLEEGVPVRIIGQGVGDCAGWSVIRAGATISWIENRYLGPPLAP